MYLYNFLTSPILIPFQFPLGRCVHVCYNPQVLLICSLDLCHTVAHVGDNENMPIKWICHNSNNKNKCAMKINLLYIIYQDMLSFLNKHTFVTGLPFIFIRAHCMK